MGGLGLLMRRRAIQAHPTISEGGYILSADKGDPEVYRILMEKGVSSDGVGITKEDAAKVTDIGTWFQNNTAIVSFNELKFFSVTNLKYRAFIGCANLTTIDFSRITKFEGSVCQDLANLESVNTDGSEWATLGNAIFSGCKKLQGKFHLRSLYGSIEYKIFANTAIESLAAPFCTSFGAYQGMINCSNLKYVFLGENCSYIGTAQIFSGCTSLEALIFNNATPVSLYSSSTLNRPTNCPIYVPDNAVEAYKVAGNYGNYASYIRPISQLKTDLPDIYNDIAEYL